MVETNSLSIQATATRSVREWDITAGGGDKFVCANAQIVKLVTAFLRAKNHDRVALAMSGDTVG